MNNNQKNIKTLTHEIYLRPRYGEVDRMGYVYHSNHVCYCHLARTELLRRFGLHDKKLEENNIMLPVLSFNIDYKKPAFYDELLTIRTIIKKIPRTRLLFEFEIINERKELIGTANSSVVFINASSRKPIKTPEWIENIFLKYLKTSTILKKNKYE